MTHPTLISVICITEYCMINALKRDSEVAELEYSLESACNLPEERCVVAACYVENA
jgi:hypothetical protein